MDKANAVIPISAESELPGMNDGHACQSSLIQKACILRRETLSYPAGETPIQKLPPTLTDCALFSLDGMGTLVNRGSVEIADSARGGTVVY